MAESQIVKNARDGLVQIINGTRTYNFSIEQGNFAATGLNEGNYDTTNVMDRGEPVHRRRTVRRPIPFTLTIWYRDLVDAADVTAMGMLLRLGVCATDLSISGLSTSEVYEVDIRWTVTGTTHGDAANHVMLLEDCRIDSVDPSEAEDKNVIAISGICYGTVTLT